MTATRRRAALAAVLAVLSLPLVVIAAEMRTYRARNRHDHSIVSGGRVRDFVLYVPTRHDRRTSVPLVLSFHGAGSSGPAQRDISRWHEIAEREGFIVAYPSGERVAGPRIWRVDGSGDLRRDVRFVADLIDTLHARYNIDTRRIYANGLSNGGGMSFALSCTMSHRIAAVGLVGAALTLPWEWCRDSTPMPMIAIHGTADRETPYRGSSSWVSRRPFPDIVEWTRKWSRRNRCNLVPLDTTITPDVTKRTYADCVAPVVMLTVHGGGHTWPGDSVMIPQWLLGRTTMSFSASEAMWAFFRDHRR